MNLDATAGNQTMWVNKGWEHIFHIDMERKLTVKPDMFCLNTQTPFQDSIIDNIFYDPPHLFGHHNSLFSIPDRGTFRQIYPEEKGIPRYYGADKYKTQTALIHHVYDAQKEFLRILKEDGLLFLKWNESCIHINTILRLFEDWHELLRIPVKLNNPNRTTRQTYWIVLGKKKKKNVQISLI